MIFKLEYTIHHVDDIIETQSVLFPVYCIKIYAGCSPQNLELTGELKMFKNEFMSFREILIRGSAQNKKYPNYYVEYRGTEEINISYFQFP